MTDSERPAGVVVGVDRSVGARTAARWAVGEAARLGEPLTVVTVTPEPPGWGSPHDLVESADRAGWGLVNEVITELTHLQPAVAVSGEVLTGSPRRLLGDIAEAAGTCVVGARSAGGFPDLLLGSTAEHVAHHAHWRAVIVRGAEQPGPNAAVVVAVDGGDPAHAAAAYAFEQAAFHSAPLVAITSANVPVEVLDYFGFGPTHARMQHASEEAGATIEAMLAPLRARFPAVAVDLKVFSSAAAMHVLRFAKGAGLVVTGSRGHRAGGAVLVGSVSRQILQYAPCSVAVVHR